MKNKYHLEKLLEIGRKKCIETRNLTLGVIIFT